MNGQFEFQFPWVLGLLVLLPAYALLHGRTGGRSALRFSSADIARAAGAKSRALPGSYLLFLRLLAVALGIVALAGPRRANDHIETETPGIDIMLVLDLSWSMEAIDMGRPEQKLSRFAIASGVLRDFIAERPHDRIGLIAFSGVPYLASPLTLNHDWLLENLARLHIGIITDLGTAIGDAVAVAAKRLKSVPNSKSRIMILLTDGDNNLGKIDPLPAAQLAAALGVKIYAVGIGIEQPCNLPRFDPATGNFLLDANGNVIPTLLLQPANYAVLGKMADLSGGRFYRATNQRELQNIYHQIDQLEKTEVKLRRFTTYQPLFQWWLAAALGVLAVEWILVKHQISAHTVMTIADFHFAEPGWLWLAAIAPLVLAGLHWHTANARREQLGHMASPHFLPVLTASHSPARRRFKEILLLLATLLAGIALARPQWGRTEREHAFVGEDVVFVLDCSLSMTTTDVLPSRLQRAKFAMLDFARRQSHGRVGLVAFAGSAFIQCPLTFDLEAFEETLMGVDEKAMPIPGTDIGRALNEANRAMDKQARHKLVVLVTDGEDLEKSGVAVAKSLATNGVVVFTIGVGTASGSEIQTVNAAGQTEWLRDANGDIVRSRLDETTLREIAEATGGSYYPLGTLGEGLMKIGPSIRALENANGSSTSTKKGVDRFYWFVGAMLALLVGESVVSTRRKTIIHTA